VSIREDGAVTGQQRRDDISAALIQVRGRIDAAVRAAGRSDEVQLIVVTKTFPASDVLVLAELGVSHVAENRDQEARAKQAEVGGGHGLRWHMIGQLQRNKAASVGRWADVVESVDRAELIAPLSRAADEHDRRLDVLIQVALDPVFRPERGGADPAGVLALADQFAGHPALTLRGVMGVAPWPGDVDDAFERLRVVSQQLQTHHPAATIVSAGMSGDLEQAIAHGATQVRIGGAILGTRAAVQ